MQNPYKDRFIASLSDLERAALVQKKGWAMIPTELFKARPDVISDMWDNGLLTVYWSPRAIEMRAYLIEKRKHDPEA